MTKKSKNPLSPLRHLRIEPLPPAQGFILFLPEILDSILCFCPRSVLINSTRFVNKDWYRASQVTLQRYHNLVWNHSLVEPLPIQPVPESESSSVNGEESNGVNAQDVLDPVAPHDLTAPNTANDSTPGQTPSRRQQASPQSSTATYTRLQ
ncbi:hypothetical protein BGZ94_001245 [Podila epigama]|nr:hypothetical protein BGZ94_001245 [Podila epigama]